MIAARHLCVCCGVRLRPYTRSTRCAEHRSVRPTPDEALVDHGETRFEADPWAVEIASRGGCTLTLVADALAISRERVRQIEEAALRKLIPRLALVGIDATDIARGFAERPGSPYAEHSPSLPVGADARERRRAANRAYMARRREQERHAAPPERQPEGAWSDHGQRVEAALEAAELAADRAELASLRGWEVTP